jgi:hypothetical protein
LLGDHLPLERPWLKTTRRSAKTWGKRTLILRADLDEFLHSLPESPPSSFNQYKTQPALVAGFLLGGASIRDFAARHE